MALSDVMRFQISVHLTCEIDGVELQQVENYGERSELDPGDVVYRCPTCGIIVIAKVKVEQA